MNVRKAIKRSVFIVLALVFALYLVYLAGIWSLQERLFFAGRTHEIEADPSSRDWPYEEVWLDVAGEKTLGWWLPLPGADGTVLLSHGSGRNIGGYLDDVAYYRDLGLSVLLYDYGGYGLSTGAPSEARCCADARAMWDHLVAVRKIPPEKIVLAGSSMGGGITAELASHVSPAAIILESTFTSIPDSASETIPLFPANWLCRIQFRNIDKVEKFVCPVLIIHSRDDTVVPFEHSQRLFERVTAPKMFVEIHGAHHRGKFTSRDAYFAGLKGFFEKFVPLRKANSAEQ